jgi:ribosome-associated translation inhibitor RaiA
MTALPKVRLLVMERVDQLVQLHGRMMGCQVVVEATEQQDPHGAPFAVRVDLQLPRNDRHVRTNHRATEHHSDITRAVGAAFDSLKRVIQSMRPLHDDHQPA